MRYGPDHKTETRQRILRSASRQLRARGLTEPAVADLMKASGLTHGGFYKHFGSRDDLVTEAIGETLRATGEQLLPTLRKAPRGQGWKELVKWYLSLEHCEHPEAGCAIAALIGDIGRARPALKKQIVGNIEKHRDQLIPFMPGRTHSEQERNFVLIFSAMIGAISLARIMPKAEMKQNILNTVRDDLLGRF